MSNSSGRVLSEKMKKKLQPWFLNFQADWFPSDVGTNDRKQEDYIFEAFCNYYIINTAQRSASKPKSFRTADSGKDTTNDGHIDGVGVFVNGIHCETIEKVEEVAANNKTIRVELHLTQAKNGKDDINSGAINNFLSGARRFISDSEWPDYDASEMNDHLAEAQKAFAKTFEYRYLHGPEVHLHWAVSTRENVNAFLEDIDKSVNVHVKALEEEKSDLVSLIDLQFHAADELIQAAANMSVRNKSVFDLPSNARLPLPEASKDLQSSFFAYVAAREYLRIIAPEGKLDDRLFEENVRDFKGKKTEVYRQIIETLRDPDGRKQFPFLNNGVTILAEEIGSIRNCEIENYQVVNGCQTSNALYDFYVDNHEDDSVLADVYIPVRFIRTDKSEVIDNIVYATNCQEPVKPEELASRTELARQLERQCYRDDVEEPIAFERREGQYIRNDPPGNRNQILNKSDFTAAFVACVMGKPHEAIGYVDKYVNGKKSIWNHPQNVSLLYTCGYLSNRVVNSHLLDERLINLRFHIMNSVFAQLSKELPRAYSAFESAVASGEGLSQAEQSVERAAERLLKKLDNQQAFERAMSKAVASANALANTDDFRPQSHNGIVPRSATKRVKSSSEFFEIDSVNRP